MDGVSDGPEAVREGSSVKYKLETVIEWAVMDALWWMTAILGVVYHHQPWFWVFAFLTWFLFLAWGLFALAKSAARAQKIPLKTEDRSVPKQVAIFSDFSIACLMAFTGHSFYAVLVVLQMMFEQFYFMKDEVTLSGD